MSDSTTLVPDRDALARVGRQVRARLEADDRIYKLPTDKAEIYAIGDFATAPECARLRLMIDAVAQPSELYEGTAQEGFRTSYSGNFDPTDPFVIGLSRRIDDLLGLKAPLGEMMQGQRYQPGQQFKPHHDFFHMGTGYWERERRCGGQRSWTAMLFLNDVEQGGQTKFTDIGLAVDPREGVLLIWNNATPEGVPNRDTIHTGSLVERGTKYVITKWYRTRRWGGGA